MMRLRLDSLTLMLRRGQRQIDLSHAITYVHGQVSTGKSSIARLIDFCLGGSLERTPALASELVAVTLSAQVGEYDVVFEREAQGSQQVRLTWEPRGGVRDGREAGQALVPTGPAEAEEGELANFSDYMFFLFGRSPIRVRRSKDDPDSPLVRLGFRAFLPFCYLRQEDLDSSFMRFNKPYEGAQSRDVMRVVLGLYNERIAELEQLLDTLLTERRAREKAADEVERFLEDLGFETETELAAAIETIQRQLADAELALHQERYRDQARPHVADELREQLRAMSAEIEQEHHALGEVDGHHTQQVELRSELLTAKVRLFRSQRATALLSSQPFEHCPRCGADMRNRLHETDKCPLCLTPESVRDAQLAPVDTQTASADLDARIGELDESIGRLERSRAAQAQRLARLRQDKRQGDEELATVLADYDSAVLARARAMEREVAHLRERSRSLEEANRVRVSAARLRRQAAEMEGEISAARLDLQEARKRVDPRRYLREIESAFLEALLAVGMPGVREFDSVEVDPRTLVPSVVPGDEGARWSFDTVGSEVATAGSGGKKTLFHICYALALHRVCAENELDLPTMLIIDTPMKNIGEDVDAALFHGFYRYLYTLAEAGLGETQLLIIDKEYEPPPDGLDATELFMERGDPEHPPLVPYYEGP
jgi:rubrerythrin